MEGLRTVNVRGFGLGCNGHNSYSFYYPLKQSEGGVVSLVDVWSGLNFPEEGWKGRMIN